jgi:membrane protease YdiL (CAAX protease family)
MNPLLWAKRHAIAVGLLLIFACTWAIDLTLAAQARGWLPPILPEWLALCTGYAFIIATLLATFLTAGTEGVRRLLRRFLIWRVHPIWYALVLLGPVVIALTAILLAVAVGAPIPDFSQPFVRRVIGVDPSLSLLVVALIWLLFEIATNGEEIFWRGYLLPKLLARYNPLLASLTLGVFWALWHLPKFAMGGVAAAAHAYPFWLLALNIIAESILFTWLYQHTQGSLLLATLFHAAINTAFVCLPVSVDEPSGALPFYLAIALTCLWALAVVAFNAKEMLSHNHIEENGKEENRKEENSEENQGVRELTSGI